MKQMNQLKRMSYANIFKLLRKPLTLILVCILSTASINSFAQTAKITIQKSNVSLKEVLNEIEKQTNYLFIYDDKINTNTKVTVKANNESVSTVLQRILNKNIDFVLEGKHIILSPTRNSKSTSDKKESTLTIEKQRRTITGTVANINGEPIVGASIFELGNTGNATISLDDGSFKLSIDNGATIRVSSVGYYTKDILISNSSIYNVVLDLETKIGEEVVVVGYGTQSKRKVTGAVSTLNSDQILQFPTVSPEQSLQGQAMGVTVINNGSPGAAPIIRVRGLGTIGDNNPVYVVDGVLTDNIGNLSSSDIESISVLKDASTAAVYGSLGANGVIVINTKKGKAGKISLSFDGYFGIQSKPKKMDLLNAAQYVEYAKDLQKNANVAIPVRLTDPQYASFISNNTDWQDAIMQTGKMQGYNFSVAGGGDMSRVRFSAGYLNQDGILLSTNVTKYNIGVNSDFKIGKLTIGENITLSSSSRNPLINANGRSPFENAIKIAPYLPVYNKDHIGGFQGPDIIDGQDGRNAVRTLKLEKQIEKANVLLGNVFAEYKLLNTLTYKFLAGADIRQIGFERFANPFYDGEMHSQTTSIISKSSANNESFLINNSINFKKTLQNAHFIDVLLLAENQNSSRKYLKGEGGSDLSNTFDQLTGGTVNSSKYEYRRIGYLGRLNYDYLGRYIVALSIRRDGSSRFGANYRWGTFPSVALGWRIHEENFLKNNSNISNFKLRFSWGLAGNDKIGDYGYEQTLNPNFYYGLTTNAVAPSRIGNPDLKWEQTEMTNAGFDLGLFDNRFNFSAEYYKKKSSDLLILVPPAASIGVTESTYKNIGGMETSGFEFSLGYNENRNALKWGFNSTLSTTKNKITKLADNVLEYLGGTFYGDGLISRISVGEPLWYFYGFKTDGIFQNQAEINAAATQTNVKPGDIRFVDVNGDKTIDAKDKVKIGNPFPNIIYSFSGNMAYSGFDFSFLLTGVHGNKIFNVNRFFLDGGDRIFNAGTIVLNRWHGEGTSNSVPRAITGDPNKNTRVSDRYVEDGSYLRLRNLTLGYHFQKPVLDRYLKNIFTGIRIYVSAQNMLTFTKYTGYDPEIGMSTTDNYELGIDRGLYPQPKSIIFGFQFKF